MSLIAATRTAARLAREPEPRPRADEIERRAVRADELARRRTKVAFTNARDRSRELGLERWHIRVRERRRDDLVRLLEKLVRNLDLARTCAQADQRIHEPLQRVLRLDDLGRRSALERVRLVVDNQRLGAFSPEDVEAAADDDALMLERERPLGPSAGEPRHPSGEVGLAVRIDKRRDTIELLGGHLRVPPADRGVELVSRWCHRIVESNMLEEPMDGVADLVRGQPPCPIRARLGSLARREPEDPFGEVAIGAALEERESAVRQPPNVVRLRRRDRRERRKLDAEPQTGGRKLAEERELQLVVGGFGCLGLGERSPPRVARTD